MTPGTYKDREPLGRCTLLPVTHAAVCGKGSLRLRGCSSWAYRAHQHFCPSFVSSRPHLEAPGRGKKSLPRGCILCFSSLGVMRHRCILHEILAVLLCCGWVPEQAGLLGHCAASPWITCSFPASSANVRWKGCCQPLDQMHSKRRFCKVQRCSRCASSPRVVTAQFCGPWS